PGSSSARALGSNRELPRRHGAGARSHPRSIAASRPLRPRPARRLEAGLGYGGRRRGEEAGAGRHSGYVPARGRPHRAFGGPGGYFRSAFPERGEV
nr:hypothetical protein [Tanacetum cinerariifolium]